MSSSLICDPNNPFFKYDLDKLCAICHRLLEKDKIRTIHDAIPMSEPEINAFQVFRLISQFTCEDGPQHLCLTCFHNTVSAYKFQKMCNIAQENIESFLRHQREIKCSRQIIQEESTVQDEAEPMLKHKTFQDDKCDDDIAKENATINNKKNKPRNRQIECKVCHIVLRSDRMNVHMRKHTGEKPYACELCDASFAQCTSLKYHMDIHENKRRFMCNYCGKSFNMLSNLNKHEITHTSERPYSCDFCDKTFTTSSSRNRHNLVHTKEKRFQCEVCPKQFARNTHLKQHLLTHSGVKNHECHLCGNRFTQAQSLRSHLKFSCHAMKPATVVSVVEIIDADSVDVDDIVM